MTIPQCIHYALDRPTVLSCLPDTRSIANLEDVLKYYSASGKERDYSFIGSLPHRRHTEHLHLLQHCQPCPSVIDICSVNKYMDLAKVGDELAKDHYLKLNKNVKACIECGVCEKNCPFHVDICGRVREAKNYFENSR